MTGRGERNGQVWLLLNQLHACEIDSATFCLTDIS